jgi:hypothetical protein
MMTSFKRFLVHLLSFSVVTLGMASCGPLGDGTQSGSGALSEDRNGGGDGKVTICHIPPGNPANAHTITVGAPAVKAHLAHGDEIGPCGGGGGDDGGTGGGGDDGGTGGGGGGTGDDGGTGGGGDDGGTGGGGGGTGDDGGGQTCGLAGDACTVDSDCCSPLRCILGACTFIPG